MNYYPHHIGDFRSGTINMTRLERWIYRDLMDVYYDTERLLPLDIEKVCDLVGARTDEECKIVTYLLRFKFQKRDDGYFHERCDAEITNYHLKAETARANGRNGGRPPQAKPNQNKPSGLSVVTGSEPDRNRIGTGLQANQEPITNTTKSKPLAQNPTGFARFWSAYPKKKSKGDAEKAFKSIKPSEQVLEAILQAITRAMTSAEWVKDGGQYVPYPATWLRAKGWEDEVSGVLTPDGCTKPWWESSAGIVAKGREFNMEQTEPVFALFRDRVFVAAGNGPWNRGRA